MSSNPDAPRDPGAPFADTIDEIVGKLEAYTDDRIQNKSFLGPVPTRLHLTVRPLGSHMTMQLEIPVDTGRKQHQFPSQWVRDELRKIFRAAENMSSKKRTLLVEVVSEFGVKIIDILVSTAKRVKAAVPGVAPAPVSEHAPAPESAAAEPFYEAAQAPLPVPAGCAPEETPQDDPELIDFGTMKYFPTDMTHKVVKKTLLAAGITTKSQLLDLLGTTEPTRMEWDIFIKKLSKIARDAGFKFFSSSDGTLYWWLTKRAKWIKPFTGTS